jgi:hypothetical protein
MEQAPQLFDRAIPLSVAANSCGAKKSDTGEKKISQLETVGRARHGRFLE